MRALAIKGDLPRELGPLYGLSFTAEDLSKDEYAWTRRSTLWEMGTQVAAVAGNASRVVFTSRVAAASQRAVLAVVDEIEISTPTAGGTGIHIALNFLGAGIADPTLDANRRDDRLLGKGTNAFSCSGGAPAGASPIAALPNRSILVPVSTVVTVKGPWVMTNNDNGIFRAGLLVICTTLNVDLRVNMKWRERDLLAEEI